MIFDKRMDETDEEDEKHMMRGSNAKKRTKTLNLLSKLIIFFRSEIRILLLEVFLL